MVSLDIFLIKLERMHPSLRNVPHEHVPRISTYKTMQRLWLLRRGGGPGFDATFVIWGVGAPRMAGSCDVVARVRFWCGVV